MLRPDPPQEPRLLAMIVNLTTASKKPTNAAGWARLTASKSASTLHTTSLNRCAGHDGRLRSNFRFTLCEFPKESTRTRHTNRETMTP